MIHEPYYIWHAELEYLYDTDTINQTVGTYVERHKQRDEKQKFVYNFQGTQTIFPEDFDAGVRGRQLYIVVITFKCQS